MNYVIEKPCTQCGTVKYLTQFGKNKNFKDGYQYRCKKCKRKADKEYNINNNEAISKKRREKYKNNKEHFSKQYAKHYRPKSIKNKIQQHINYLSYPPKCIICNKIIPFEKWLNHRNMKCCNRECYNVYKNNDIFKKIKRKKYHKSWYQNNKEHVNKWSEQYRNNNRDKINKRLRNKRKNNINFKIACNLRKRINEVLKENYKSASTVELLGCTIQEFKDHLESLFDNKMNWDNHGSYWHVDHILPCAAFQLQHSEEQEICFHYTNLRPLEAKENLKKQDKIIV